MVCIPFARTTWMYLNETMDFDFNSLFSIFSQLAYETLIVTKQDGVGLITLNRPKALNALNSQMIKELNLATKAFDSDTSVGSIVITGSEKYFAAGADIKEMASKNFEDVYLTNMFADLGNLLKVIKPIIGAVNGYALGGGCELAMLCDIIIAGENAQFGQPEITLGVTPGMGGCQLLTRAVGKSKAMEMTLTGNRIDAKEAMAFNLVSRVEPVEKTVEKAIEIGQKIASYSQLAVALTKEAVHIAHETTQAEGLRAERRLFHACFSTRDQKEGMKAFIEKRKPVWEHK